MRLIHRWPFVAVSSHLICPPLIVCSGETSPQRMEEILLFFHPATEVDQSRMTSLPIGQRILTGLHPDGR